MLMKSKRGSGLGSSRHWGGQLLTLWACSGRPCEVCVGEGRVAWAQRTIRSDPATRGAEHPPLAVPWVCCSPRGLSFLPARPGHRFKSCPHTLVTADAAHFLFPSPYSWAPEGRLGSPASTPVSESLVCLAEALEQGTESQWGIEQFS